MRGLFYNTKKAECSIHESGLMAYRALGYSNKYTLDYLEYPAQIVTDNYDFIVMNWHHVVMSRITPSQIGHVQIPIFTLVTEVAPDKPLPNTPKWFDGYLVLDPTYAYSDTMWEEQRKQCSMEKVWWMPRPLDEFVPPKREQNDVPVIGSFGFATQGKRFDLVIQAASESLDEAIVRINIPGATYVDKIHFALGQKLAAMGNDKIKVEVTHTYFSQTDLIKWCYANDLNAFFYYRNMTGLAAVTDQAISSQQPLLVTEDYTFRHIHKYMGYYPQVSIKEALEMKEPVQQMYQDWHPSKFSERFEEILANA